MRVTRPRQTRRTRGDDLDDWLGVYGGMMVHGSATSSEHPWDWSDDVTEQLAAELEDRLARKRPAGFAPWPDEKPALRRVA